MFSVFLTIAAIHLLAVMSPGPDLALVVKNSLVYSRKQSFFSVLGICAGNIIHLTYSFLGLAIIIAKVPSIFQFVKFAGICYIVFLSVSSFREFMRPLENKYSTGEKDRSKNLLKFFKDGFFTNLLNVNAMLYYLSIFSQFLTKDMSITVQGFYALEILMITFLWFLSCSIILTYRQIQNKINIYSKWVSLIFSVVFMIFAGKLLYTLF